MTQTTLRWQSDSQTYNFHAAPDAGYEDGENRDYPDDLVDIVADVGLPWVDRRIGDVWGTAD